MSRKKEDSYRYNCWTFEVLPTTVDEELPSGQLVNKRYDKLGEIQVRGGESIVKEGVSLEDGFPREKRRRTIDRGQDGLPTCWSWDSDFGWDKRVVGCRTTYSVPSRHYPSSPHHYTHHLHETFLYRLLKDRRTRSCVKQRFLTINTLSK